MKIKIENKIDFSNYPKLGNYTLSSYYMDFCRQGPIGILPALDKNDNKNHWSYYSVPSAEDENKRFSPYFEYGTTEIPDISSLKNKDFRYDDFKTFFSLDLNKFFRLTEREWSELWSYNNGKFTPKKDFWDKWEKFVLKPYRVYFKGCDDGSIVLRFKDKEEFDKFMSQIEYFEEIWDFADEDEIHYEN